MSKINKKLKILQISTFFHPVIGGVETQVEDLSKQLIKKGHQVEIITTDSDRNGKKINRQAIDSKVSGIKVSRVKTWFSFSEFHKFAPGFWNAIKNKEFDIIHIHGLRKFEMYIALFIAKLKRKKIVVSTHNPFTVKKRSKKMKIFIFFHDLFLGIIFMRFFDHYFLLCKSEKKFLKRFGISENKMSITGNAINDQFFIDKNTHNNNQSNSFKFSSLSKQKLHEFQEFLEKFNLSPKKHWQAVVLCVGRLEERKGFQYLEEAVKELDRVIFLIIGGDNGYLNELKKTYMDYDNIIFTETFLSRDQLIQYYRQADIFALPSEHEPFGIVLLEAMAQKCAAIATIHGGPSEILKEDIQGNEYGILLDPEKKKLWKDIISNLISNPDNLIKWQEKAYQRALQYSWENILPKYLKIYKHLCSFK